MKIPYQEVFILSVSLEESNCAEHQLNLEKQFRDLIILTAMSLSTQHLLPKTLLLQLSSTFSTSSTIVPSFYFSLCTVMTLFSRPQSSHRPRRPQQLLTEIYSSRKMSPLQSISTLVSLVQQMGGGQTGPRTLQATWLGSLNEAFLLL